MGSSSIRPTPPLNDPTCMRAASTFLSIGMAFCIATPAAHGLGFGRVTNTTQLGQPLDFSVALNLESDELLARECVFAEVTSGENRLLPTQVRVTLEGVPDGSPRQVRVLSNAMIDEPVVAVSVTLGCIAKVTRRFVAFIDPPATDVASADSLPAPAIEAQRAETQVAPLVALVQGERAAASSPVSRLSPPAVSASTLSPSRHKTKLAHPNTVTVVAARGSRLQLEAAPPAELIAAAPASAGIPVSTAAAAAPVVAAASAAAIAEAQGAIADQERQQRLQALEDGVATLRARSTTTEQALAQLQSKLKTAEADRYANPLVYALAALSAMLAVAVAALWWRQSRGRRGTQWWTAPPLAAPANSSERHGTPNPADISPSALADLALVETPADAWTATSVFGPASEAVSAAEVVRIYQAELGMAAHTVTQPMASQSLAAPAPEPTRELSVEELIDLEQQVEFFIVLGQDDAAIELLMSHVRSDGGASPLPYLKLLEIYRRLGDAPAYERIRDRFNRRFNAYAPDWEADLQHGRVLADYPETVTQLQAAWATPLRVMQTLDASLFRRQPNGQTYDLPAYRELLFLYSIVRDLAEQEGGLDSTTGNADIGSAASSGSAPVATPDREHDGSTAGVDLLLPFGDESEAAPIARLHATSPFEVEVAPEIAPSKRPVDLDVTFIPAGFQAASAFIDFDVSEVAPTEPKRVDRG